MGNQTFRKLKTKSHMMELMLTCGADHHFVVAVQRCLFARHDLLSKDEEPRVGFELDLRQTRNEVSAPQPLVVLTFPCAKERRRECGFVSIDDVGARATEPDAVGKG